MHQKGLNINDLDIHGQSPLFYASRDNKITVALKLIEMGVEVNVVDNLQQQTPLFYSAREGHLEMCKILIENGCKAAHLDTSKKNAMYFAKKNNRKDVVDYLTSLNHKMAIKIK